MKVQIRDAGLREIIHKTALALGMSNDEVVEFMAYVGAKATKEGKITEDDFQKDGRIREDESDTEVHQYSEEVQGSKMPVEGE